MYNDYILYTYYTYNVYINMIKWFEKVKNMQKTATKILREFFRRVAGSQKIGNQKYCAITNGEFWDVRIRNCRRKQITMLRTCENNEKWKIVEDRGLWEPDGRQKI